MNNEMPDFYNERRIDCRNIWSKHHPRVLRYLVNNCGDTDALRTYRLWYITVRKWVSTVSKDLPSGEYGLLGLSGWVAEGKLEDSPSRMFRAFK